MIRYARGVDSRTMPGNDQRVTTQATWLRDLPNDIRTILDVGAGAGSHSGLFHEQGLRVTAIDQDAENFRFHDRVEFIEGDVLEWDEGRTFDAVFCSHVLEHAPNPQSFLTRLRSLVREGGYLIVVVPPYEATVSDEHWNIGWTCPQLAMVLVACGFDCSRASFAELPQNVCGWGVKRDFPPTDFMVARSFPFLPKAMAESIVASGEGHLHIGDLVRANDAGVRLRPRSLFMSERAFAMDDCLEVRIDRQSRQDGVRRFEIPVDLRDKPIRLVFLHEGEAASIRIALDSSTDGSLDSVSEWFANHVAGVTVAELRDYDFRPVVGTTDFGAITSVIVGGEGDGATIRCWAYAGESLLLGGTSGETGARPRSAPPDEPRSDRRLALAEAELYFHKNRAARLERALARLRAEIETAAGPSVPRTERLGREGVADLLASALRALHRPAAPPTRPGTAAGPSPEGADSVEYTQMADLLALALRAVHRPDAASGHG